MNRIKISAIVLSFVILSGCDAVPTGDARIGWFPARLSGDIALDAQSGSGRNLDVVRADVNDDLGLGRSGNVMAGAAIDSPLGRVSASYFRYSDDGTGTLTRSFGDIPPGTNVASETSIDNVKAFWSFDLVDTGVVRLSPGVGVDYFSLDATVRSITALSAYERLSVGVPMPMLFLTGAVDLGPVSGELEGGWMHVNVSNVDATFYDLDARVVWKASSAFEAFGGYRWVTLDSSGRANGQQYDANLDLQGVYFGGGLRF
ncbi:MAG: hypothetical protein U1F36_17760 [Planctomycetota bacterium]